MTAKTDMYMEVTIVFRRDSVSHDDVGVDNDDDEGPSSESATKPVTGVAALPRSSSLPEGTEALVASSITLVGMGGDGCSSARNAFALTSSWLGRAGLIARQKTEIRLRRIP